jgi:hypothetical protein
MSRFVELLAPIQPIDLTTGDPVLVQTPDFETKTVKMLPAPPIGFMAWLFQVIGGGKDGAHPKLGKGVELADRIFRLRAVFTDPMKQREVNGAQYGEVEEADWQAVADVIADFQPLNALLWAQMGPFMHAWKPDPRHDESWLRSQTMKAVEG